VLLIIFPLDLLCPSEIFDLAYIAHSVASAGTILSMEYYVQDYKSYRTCAYSNTLLPHDNNWRILIIGLCYWSTTVLLG
jgi:hypothetical protein